MKRLLVRALALIPVLFVVLPFQVAPSEGGATDPFLMRILDERGQGVANIRVVSDNGIVCHTRADGSVRWTERSVMNRDVRFRLDSSKRPAQCHAPPHGWRSGRCLVREVMLTSSTSEPRLQERRQIPPRARRAMV